ncbi:MAG: hypothetical protein C0423_05770 [Methylibium sp.]|nr:hypothetical protein [Methylibium sp.]
MDSKPAPAKSDAAMPARRPALDLAAQTASTSYKCMLPPEVLGEALRTGVMPAGFEPHIGSLLDEAPLSLLGRVAAQISAAAALSVEQVWANMQELAAQLQITREINVPAMLKDQQARDSAEVAIGQRSARSLWVVQPGDLDGYTFTPPLTSEHDKPGEEW